MSVDRSSTVFDEPASWALFGSSGRVLFWTMDRASEIIAKAIGFPGGPGPVRGFLVEPTGDSEGRDALDVTIIIKDDTLSGPDAAVLLTNIQSALMASGDERFPIVQFATEDELARDGGPQP